MLRKKLCEKSYPFLQESKFFMFVHRWCSLAILWALFDQLSFEPIKKSGHFLGKHGSLGLRYGPGLSPIPCWCTRHTLFDCDLLGSRTVCLHSVCMCYVCVSWRLVSLNSSWACSQFLSVCICVIHIRAVHIILYKYVSVRRSAVHKVNVKYWQVLVNKQHRVACHFC